MGGGVACPGNQEGVPGSPTQRHGREPCFAVLVALCAVHPAVEEPRGAECDIRGRVPSARVIAIEPGIDVSEDEYDLPSYQHYEQRD